MAPDRRVADIIIAERADGQQFTGVACLWRAGADPDAAMDAHGWHATGCACGMRDAGRRRVHPGWRPMPAAG
jgi:hypothetical protein